MTGRPPRFLWPFVAAVYVLLLAPLVVVITVSFGSTSTFDFPPKGLSFKWYQAFFASEMFVRSFFRVSQVVGLSTAGVVAIAVVAVWQGTRVGDVRQAAPQIVAELRSQAPEPVPAPPADVPSPAMQSETKKRSKVAETRPPTRLADEKAAPGPPPRR